MRIADCHYCIEYDTTGTEEMFETLVVCYAETEEELRAVMVVFEMEKERFKIVKNE